MSSYIDRTQKWEYDEEEEEEECVRTGKYISRTNNYIIRTSVLLRKQGEMSLNDQYHDTPERQINIWIKQIMIYNNLDSSSMCDTRKTQQSGCGNIANNVF